LIIVGDGPLREYLKGIAEKAKLNVKFIHGGIHHEDLPVYYNEVGFFVAPSRTEAQGVAMCEALACGTPAIATKVGGIPEFVIHGYNGILVRPEPKELQKAIIALSKMSIENYCKMSQNAVQHARTTFSDEIVIPKELELLSKAIELYDKYGRTY
jgi:glycosyltransferase involved in cell wall biosynthesis